MVDDNGPKKTAKPFYRNVEDTLEDVGITQRQLGYWRKHGLFVPELGPKAKFFTKDDTAQLRFLKRLIDDLGLPVATVKRLIDSVDETNLWINAATDMTFIDITNASLVLPYDAMMLLAANAIAGADAELRDRWFRVMALQQLQAMARNSATYEVYEAQKKAFLDQLERLDLLARFRSDGKNYVLSPARDTDPVLSDDLVDQLVKDQERYEGEIRKARIRQIRSRSNLPPPS